jgi:signal transduction histidine kinase
MMLGTRLNTEHLRASNTVPSTLETPATSNIWRTNLLIIVCCLPLSGCLTESANVAPSIEINRIPLIDEGGTGKMAVIAGRVNGARAGQQIVLFARSGTWYVQPFTDQPFTKIQSDSTWSNSTHLGTEYAALLVEPGYRPPATVDVIPNKGGGVIAVLVAPGEVRLLVPVFWQTWWFRLSSGLACLFALLVFHRLRLRQLTRQLNARFDARLEERMRLAQDLHDTLLQGFLSASMQLYVAVEQLPEDSPARARLNQVQQLMGRVIEEGRNTLHGLRSITTDSLDLEQAFSRIPQDFAGNNEIGAQIEFRVIIKGRPRPLHPIIRDEIYRIGREALIIAFRNPRTKSVGVELKYSARRLRLFVRDDGSESPSQALRSGREEPVELARMRERAGRIGARLKLRGLAPAGTEVEISIPSQVAFPNRFSMRPMKWLAGLSPLLKTISRKK